MNYAVDMWISKLQGRIDACEYCQPYDNGETVWIAGVSQSVAEFLYDNNVPEDLHERVAVALACGQCACSLQLDTEIVVDSYESQLDEAAGDRFGLWVVEDNPRLNSFVEHLQHSSGPLGRGHDVGEELFTQLKELAVSTAGEDWWRARSFAESARSPAPLELGPPPKPSDTRGRFSPAGQRVFYLGSTKSAAITEARKYRKPSEQVWVQHFRIRGVDRIVTLAPKPFASDPFRQTEIPILVAGLMWCNGLVQQREGEEQKLEYLLPQFIADCALEIGIQGILFNSLLHHDKNLVLFSWNDEDVTAIGTPESVP